LGKRKINAKAVIKDIKDGFDDVALMDKYELSSDNLQKVFKELVKNKKISQAELDYRNQLTKVAANAEDLRELPRNYPALSVMVYDETDVQQKGVVRDITTEGIGVIGIEAEVGDKRTFIIDMGKLTDFDKFEFEAECRWVKQANLDGQCVAGFHITKISDQSRRNLTDLIDGFTLTTDTVRLALS
jgi:hypothetical protein